VRNVTGQVDEMPTFRQSEGARAATATLPGQRSEPFYNRDKNFTKSFGVDLAVGNIA
jgi:hypothetical protein